MKRFTAIISISKGRCETAVSLLIVTFASRTCSTALSCAAKWENAWLGQLDYAVLWKFLVGNLECSCSLERTVKVRGNWRTFMWLRSHVHQEYATPSDRLCGWFANYLWRSQRWYTCMYASYISMYNIYSAYPVIVDHSGVCHRLASSLPCGQRHLIIHDSRPDCGFAFLCFHGFPLKLPIAYHVVLQTSIVVVGSAFCNSTTSNPYWHTRV